MSTDTISILRGRVREFRFGPGSLESIRVRVWKHGGTASNPHLHASATGFYRVYCGAGNEHAVEISMGAEGWASEVHLSGPLGVPALVVKAYGSDTDAAESLAGQLIEYALEDWSDPCEQPDDD